MALRMGRVGWVLLVVGSGCGLAVGCGGANSTAVDTGADADVADTTTGGQDGGSDSAPGSDTGSVNDVTPPKDVVTLPDGAVASDGGTTPEAGPGGSSTQLPCGSATCTIPGQTCCVYQQGGGQGAFSYLCVVGAQCPVPDAGGGNGNPPSALKCSGAANCPANTVCCVSAAGGAAPSSECKAQCGPQEAQLCDPLANPTGCPADGGNAQCSNANIGDWGLPGTYGTCGGKGN